MADEQADRKHLTESDLLAMFKRLDIETTTIEHPEVFTVDAMMVYLRNIPGGVTKNLFLKDKRKKLYLLCTQHKVMVKLNDVAKQIGASSGLRFAEESVLYEKLGVTKGCVTAFALINDVKHEVGLIVDDSLVNGTYEHIYFHPLRNSASTGITPADFLKFINATGHSIKTVQFEPAQY